MKPAAQRNLFELTRADAWSNEWCDLEAALTDPERHALTELLVAIEHPAVTAGELIELRVRDEVARFNASVGVDVFRGLIQPTETEATLNGYEYRVRRRQPVNADEQCQQARLAFESNGFLLLVGDHQVEALDEQIRVTAGLRVSFVKLVPLVGG